MTKAFTLTSDILSQALSPTDNTALMEALDNPDDIPASLSEDFNHHIADSNHQLANGEWRVLNVTIAKIKGTNAKLVVLESDIDEDNTAFTEAWRGFVTVLDYNEEKPYYIKSSLGFTKESIKNFSDAPLIASIFLSKPTKSKGINEQINNFLEDVKSALDIEDLILEKEHPKQLPFSVPFDHLLINDRKQTHSKIRLQVSDYGIALDGALNGCADAFNLRLQGVIFNASSQAVVNPVYRYLNNALNESVQAFVAQATTEKQALLIKKNLGNVWGSW